MIASGIEETLATLEAYHFYASTVRDTPQVIAFGEMEAGTFPHVDSFLSYDQVERYTVITSREEVAQPHC